MKLEINDSKDFREVVFQYESGEIPPPYCFRYRLNVIFESKQPEILFNLEYYDREELTEEEVIDEGFSLDDDFHWKGRIPILWNDVILDKILRASWKKSNKLNEQVNTAEMSVRIRYTDGNSERLWPEQLKTWEDFMQEVIQAIFEISDREMPLEVRYLEIDKNNECVEKQLTFEFAELNILVDVRINNEKVRNYSLNWESGKKIMKTIFFPDYEMELAIDKKPDKPGSFIDPGMGLWFDMGKAVHSPNAKKDSSKKIFDQLNPL